jgi:hypothetical protein
MCFWNEVKRSNSAAGRNRSICSVVGISKSYLFVRGHVVCHAKRAVHYKSSIHVPVCCKRSTDPEGEKSENLTAAACDLLPP